MTITTAWAKGVIARYLTVGGATVDITHFPESRSLATVAACTGCPAAEEFSHYRTYYGPDGFLAEKHDPDPADARARTWAQSHAETCRALPTPTV